MSRKSFKRKINNYIFSKQDICCEQDIDRQIAIQDIFSLYRKIADFAGEKDDFLDYISNDFNIFIGYLVDLKKTNDVRGIALSNSLDKKTMTNGKPDKHKWIRMLKQVPLYYLLSFLGKAYYKYSRISLL